MYVHACMCMHRPYYRLHVCVQLNQLFPNIILHLLWKKIVDKGCLCGKTLYLTRTRRYLHVCQNEMLFLLLQVNTELREMVRTLQLIRRSIREKETTKKLANARVEERERHLNMDVCSDTLLNR